MMLAKLYKIAKRFESELPYFQRSSIVNTQPSMDAAQATAGYAVGLSYPSPHWRGVPPDPAQPMVQNVNDDKSQMVTDGMYPSR